jgi:wyosine [tRNA(Phe)-imidazoG37] synthetase (radical SAM superfamily)
MNMRPDGCVYGPVASRRFGLSLGVDLLPPKTCCYNCVYCQLGATSRLTTRREDFVPVEEVLREIEDALERGPRPDVITFGGSGEPTLYASLGRLIRRVRERTGIPVVLLTGGGLLSDEGVASDALEADILAPSLDAGDELRFLRVNRPHASVRFENVVRGLHDVVRSFHGPVRVEVMLVPDLNDGAESLGAIASCLRAIPSAAIEINTPMRPGPRGTFLPFERGVLDRARDILGRQANVLWHGEPTGPKRRADRCAAARPERVASLLARHPSTVREMMRGLGLSRRAVLVGLEELRRTGRLEKRKSAGIVYYATRRPSADRRET